MQSDNPQRTDVIAFLLVTDVCGIFSKLSKPLLFVKRVMCRGLVALFQRFDIFE